MAIAILAVSSIRISHPNKLRDAISVVSTVGGQ